ncbi:MAG: alpha/beta hydrolase [Hyphomonadaceae bacterium]|nr:alpha/beta hydrolase [Hyphomonadaceae bacterium]
MRFVMRLSSIWIFSLLVSGCAMAIDETTVFAPPAVEQRAQSGDELTARWPLDRLLEASPGAQVQHGFLGAPAERVAYTLATRPGPGRPLIVICGGNAADRYNSGPAYASKALPFGDILLFDYPGYGDSEGEPSRARLENASRLVAAFAVATASDQRPLVLWGHSLGGFVCGEMARQTAQTDAVILETTARSADEVADAWTPWYAAPFLRIDVAEGLATYDTAVALESSRVPVLVLGAGRDDTLPVALSRSLVSALQSKGIAVTYVEFPDAGHQNVWRQPNFATEVSPFFHALRSAQVE